MTLEQERKLFANESKDENFSVLFAYVYCLTSIFASQVTQKIV